jgi:cysteine desulfurase
MKYTYFDHAAATPIDDKVLLAMQPYSQERFYNSSALYAPAKDVLHSLEQARSQVAHWLGCRSNEFIFTAGGTEANNLAIFGIMEQYPEGNCVVSAIEHDAVLRPAERYAHKTTSVDESGRVSATELDSLVDDSTVLISVMYANNEIGVIQPIREVTKKAEEIRIDRSTRGVKTPLYVHTDACQGPNYLDLHVSRLGVDMMTLNGGKIYGPKQSGGLFVRRDISLKPLIVGGGQEKNRRSGTQNIAQSVGFSVALDGVQSIKSEEAERMHGLQKIFIEELLSTVPSAVINGSSKHRLANNVHITIPGTSNEIVLLQLEEQGILAAAGSACSADDLSEPSHVLQAMGISDALARASLRFSMGRATTEADVHHAVDALARVA